MRGQRHVHRLQGAPVARERLVSAARREQAERAERWRRAGGSTVQERLAIVWTLAEQRRSAT
ncbi:MAG TPA: hypothetical protein VNT32_04920 [Thermoleophilaceae bacterium]|nr:hypothetical protein [Thermoleophilaceae bacterium]